MYRRILLYVTLSQARDGRKLVTINLLCPDWYCSFKCPSVSDDRNRWRSLAQSCSLSRKRLVCMSQYHGVSTLWHIIPSYSSGLIDDDAGHNAP